MWLCEQVNKCERLTPSLVKVKTLAKLRVIRLNYVLLPSAASIPKPRPPAPAGFRQWGKGLPAPKRNACWCHASCKPSNPWIINSGLQTISASAVHCVFLTLDTIRAWLHGSPYITQHTIMYCISWDKSNWCATGSLYVQGDSLLQQIRGKIWRWDKNFFVDLSAFSIMKLWEGAENIWQKD